jgi:CHAT domain-containing protein/tetratricopeptide (TPR) repeat protein
MILVLHWVAALSPAVQAASTGATTERQDPAGDSGTTPAAATVELGLSDEAQETLQLIRWALEEDRQGARELLRETLAALSDPAPGGESSHVAFLRALDRLALEAGDLRAVLALRRLLVRTQERILSPDHDELLKAKWNLASTQAEAGDPSGALPIYEEVLGCYLRRHPADHESVLWAKHGLAVAKYYLGDFQGARTLQEEVLAGRAQLRPPEHLDVLNAQGNLALTKLALGDMERAHALLQDVVEGKARALSPQDPDVLKAQLNLALAKRSLGDLLGAHGLEEGALLALTALFPPEHPEVLRAKQNLAATKNLLGDLAGAQQLLEEVLAVRSRIFAPEHSDRIKTLSNLAAVKIDLGDLAAAREMLEEVVTVWTRLLPSEHYLLLTAKGNLASVLWSLGNTEKAFALQQEVLEVRTRFQPEDHWEVLMSKQALASSMKRLGDIVGARRLQEEVLANLRLPAGHPYVLIGKHNLGGTLHRLGELEGANRLYEEVLAAYAMWPPDHPHVLHTLERIALTKHDLGESAEARQVLVRLLAGMRDRAARLRSESSRVAREAARRELDRLSVALFSGASAGDAEVVATLESLRLVSLLSSEISLTIDEQPELAARLSDLAAARARLSDLARSGPPDGVSMDEWRTTVLHTVSERDRLEGALHAGLVKEGVELPRIEVGTIPAALAEDAALVSFLRCPRHEALAVDSLFAFVVRPDGSVRRIELGATDDLERIVRDWRRALGRPLGGRGEPVAEGASEEDTLESLGIRLRERVLDPILASAGEVHSLHLVPDDLLHLVPLDALPLEGGLVGERLKILNERTVARLLRARRRPVSGGMTLSGGIDYDAEVELEAVGRSTASTPPGQDGNERSGTAAFAYLPETREEASAISELYRAAFEGEPVVLAQAEATKAALFAAAPRTRWLHLATHGWFAPESYPSQLDALAPSDDWRSARSTLIGFAPETLCGLALSGANRGKDRLGRVPGILTAEELATFDLRSCELAVLSACETNVGIRRAGQGIQSLQNALHAAGARTAITSLWKVDDQATRRLFELFYVALWKQGLGKGAALWQAKMALRAEGHAQRDWAAWVLTGDPE